MTDQYQRPAVGDRALMFGAGLFVGLALGICGGAYLVTEVAPHDTTSTTPVTFEGEPGAQTYVQRMTDLLDPPAEDEPGWDAERHGNGIPGPAWDCTTMGDGICQTVVTVPASLTELMLGGAR